MAISCLSVANVFVVLLKIHSAKPIDRLTIHKSDTHGMGRARNEKYKTPSIVERSWGGEERMKIN